MTAALYVVCGEPGVGKSGVADVIARRTEGTVLRTDEIRKELFGPEPDYSSDESQQTYTEMFNRARKLLRDDEVVILDATFSMKAGRERANHLAQKYTDPYDFTIVRVTCDDSTVRKRLRERQQSGDSVSDAGVEVYEQIKESFEPIELPHVTIDNSSWWFTTTRQLRENDVYEIPSYYK